LRRILRPCVPMNSSADFGSAWTPRAELIHVLRLPDFERADAIGTYWGHPETRTFGELLIDLEEDRHLKAVDLGAAPGWSEGSRGRRGELLTAYRGSSRTVCPTSV
jgi:hypothetical protein